MSRYASETFTKCSTEIHKPSVYIVGDTSHVTALKTSSYETCELYVGKHTSTIWEFSLSPFFTQSDIIYTFETQEYLTELDLNCCSPEVPSNRTVYVRARFISGNIKSVFSNPLKIHTGSLIPMPRITEITGSLIDHQDAVNDRSQYTISITVESTIANSYPFCDIEFTSHDSDITLPTIVSRDESAESDSYVLSAIVYVPKLHKVNGRIFLNIKYKDSNHSCFRYHVIPLNIVHINHAPSITSIQTDIGSYLKKEYIYHIDVTAEDVDNDTLVYTLSTSNPDLVVSGGGNAPNFQVGIPGDITDTGLVTFTISVTDPYGKSDTTTFTSKLPEPPSFTYEITPEELPLITRTTYTLQITDVVSEAGTSNAKSLVTVQSGYEYIKPTQVSNLVWKLQTADATNSNITIRIDVQDDAGNIATKFIHTAVVDTFNITRYQVIPSVSSKLASGTSYTINICTDIDTEEHTWYLEVLNDSNNAIIGVSEALPYTQCTNGAKFIVQTSSENGGEDIIFRFVLQSPEVIRIYDRIYNVNYAPSIQSVTYSPQHTYLVSGFSYEFTINTDDPDGDDISYSLTKSIVYGTDTGNITQGSDVNQFVYTPNIDSLSQSLPYIVKLTAQVSDPYNGSSSSSNQYNETKMYVDRINILFFNNDTNSCEVVDYENTELDPEKEYTIVIYVRDDNNFDFSDFSYSGSLTNCSDSDVAVLSHEDTLCGQAQEYSFPYKKFGYKLSPSTNAALNQCDFTFNITLSNEGGSVSDQKTITLIYGASYSPPSFTLTRMDDYVWNGKQSWQISISDVDPGGSDISIEEVIVTFSNEGNLDYEVIYMFDGMPSDVIVYNQSFLDAENVTVFVTLVNSVGYRSTKSVTYPTIRYDKFFIFKHHVQSEDTWNVGMGCLQYSYSSNGTFLVCGAHSLYDTINGKASVAFIVQDARYSGSLDGSPWASSYLWDASSNPVYLYELTDTYNDIIHEVKVNEGYQNTKAHFVGTKYDSSSSSYKGLVVEFDTSDPDNVIANYYMINQTSRFTNGYFMDPHLVLVGYSGSDGVLYYHNYSDTSKCKLITISDVKIASAVLNPSYPERIYFAGYTSSDKNLVLGYYNTNSNSLEFLNKYTIETDNVNMHIESSGSPLVVAFTAITNRMYQTVNSPSEITDDSSFSSGFRSLHIFRFYDTDAFENQTFSHFSATDNYGAFKVSNISIQSLDHYNIYLWHNHKVQYGGVYSSVVTYTKVYGPFLSRTLYTSVVSSQGIVINSSRNAFKYPATILSSTGTGHGDSLTQTLSGMRIMLGSMSKYDIKNTRPSREIYTFNGTLFINNGYSTGTDKRTQLTVTKKEIVYSYTMSPSVSSTNTNVLTSPSTLPTASNLSTSNSNVIYF